MPPGIGNPEALAMLIQAALELTKTSVCSDNPLVVGDLFVVDFHQDFPVCIRLALYFTMMKMVVDYILLAGLHPKELYLIFHE